MGYKRSPFLKRGFDESEWQRAYHRHQESYLRKRLHVVKAYYLGKDFGEIHQEQGVCIQSVRKYVNEFIEGGLDYLCRKMVRNQPKKLDSVQESSFKIILLTKKLPLNQKSELAAWQCLMMQPETILNQLL